MQAEAWNFAVSTTRWHSYNSALLQPDNKECWTSVCYYIYCYTYFTREYHSYQGKPICSHLVSSHAVHRHPRINETQSDPHSVPYSHIFLKFNWIYAATVTHPIPVRSAPPSFHQSFHTLHGISSSIPRINVQYKFCVCVTLHPTLKCIWCMEAPVILRGLCSRWVFVGASACAEVSVMGVQSTKIFWRRVKCRGYGTEAEDRYEIGVRKLKDGERLRGQARTRRRVCGKPARLFKRICLAPGRMCFYSEEYSKSWESITINLIPSLCTRYVPKLTIECMVWTLSYVPETRDLAITHLDILYESPHALLSKDPSWMALDNITSIDEFSVPHHDSLLPPWRRTMSLCDPLIAICYPHPFSHLENFALSFAFALTQEHGGIRSATLPRSIQSIPNPTFQFVLHPRRPSF